MTGRSVAIPLLVLSCAGQALAEHSNVERGFQVDSAFQVGDVDQVNLFNGNLMITLPIGPRYQVGGNLDYGLNLVYNSKVWDWQHFEGGNYSKASPAFENNAGLGWQLHFGRVLPPYSSPRVGPHYLYLAGDGSEHEFFDKLHDADIGGGPSCLTQEIGYCYSRDNSYLRLRRTGGIVEIHFGNGVKHFFAPHGDRGELWLTRMEDSFGNWMAVHYTASRWTITDKWGRSHTVDLVPRWYHTVSLPTPSVIKLAAFNGQVARFDLVLTDASVERPVPHEDPGNPSPVEPFVGVPLLSQVLLPDGSSWRMPGYIVTRTDVDGIAAGAIRRLKLPTGGEIGWEYGLYQFSTDRFPFAEGHHQIRQYLRQSPGVESRNLYSAAGALLGGWSYKQDLRIVNLGLYKPVQQSTTVTDPYAHKTVHYFSAFSGGGDPEPDGLAAEPWHYGLPFTVVIQDSNGRFLSRSTTLKPGMRGYRDDYLRYEADPGGHNTRVSSSRVEEDDGKWRSEDHSDFDGLGHFRHTAIRSNYPCSSNSRNEHTAWNEASGAYPRPGWRPPPTEDRWLLGDFAYREDEEQQALRRREYHFDERGFLARERLLRQWGRDREAQDTLREFEDDGWGNPKWERYYGGFAHPIGTGPLAEVTLDPNAVGLVAFENTFQFGRLAKRRYRNANFYLLDLTIDRDSGLPASSRDVAEQETTFTYDTMGRSLTIRPPEAAWTDYQFSPSNGLSQAKAEIFERAYQGSTVLRRAELYFDEFGRLRRERKLLSSGWTERRRYHELTGDLGSLSEWQANFTAGNYTRFNNYDAWGRAHEVAGPDGRKVSHEYLGRWGHQRWWYVATQGDGVIYNDGATGESNKQEIDETFDAMGRLCRAEERNGLDATYAYDTGGKLARATLKWGPQSWEKQERIFDHDARGFLLREIHPETGAFEYRNIDARGHANIKFHEMGPGLADDLDLEFTFDDYERLVGVWDRKGQRDLKAWAYGTSNASGNIRKGKIERATRFNWRRVASAPGEMWVNVPVVETYTYGGLGGRVSARRTTLNSIFNFEQGWEWDALGNLSRQSYPRCSNGTTCAGAAPRDQQYSYNSGQLAMVAGWANLAYHDNGTVAQVRHTNQVTDFIDKDPNAMPRPANIRVQMPSATLELGMHGYDGGGNLFRQRLSPGASSFESIQQGQSGAPAPNAPEALDNYFLYDNLGRLKRFYDRAGYLQDYTYDALGNATQIGSATFAVNKANNRVEGIGFDERGNAISRFNGNGTQRDTYSWDLLDQMAHRNFPADTHLYTADGERVWSLFYVGGAFNETITLRDLNGKALSIFEKSNGGPFVWKTDYIYRGGFQLAKATSQPAPNDQLHFTLDHLGTTRIATNAQGNASENYHHYAFGEQFRGTMNSEEKLRFTGHERDKQSASTVDDLDYMHARSYAPHMGRFLTIDPVLQLSRAARTPQFWNRYSYAANSPLKYVDPTGRELELTGTAEEQKKALNDLRNGVPFHLRSFVRTTRTGDGRTIVDARYLNMQKGAESGNFQALRQVANSPGSASFNSSQNAASTTTMGLQTLGTEGTLGITLARDQSFSGKIEAFVAVDLSNFEAAGTSAHELRHVRQYLLGLPALDEYSMTLDESDPSTTKMIFALDPAGPVNIEVKAAEDEAARNYDRTHSSGRWNP